MHRIVRASLRHTSYLSFFVQHGIFWPVNCTPEKCVNLQQKFHRDRTAYLLILGVLPVLVGVLAVLVGVLAVLVGVLGVFCIGMVYLLHEMERAELGMVYLVFS